MRTIVVLVLVLTTVSWGQSTVYGPALPQTYADSSTKGPWVLTARSAAPTSPSTGMIYLDDGTNTTHGKLGFRRYTGSAWVDLGQGYDADLNIWDDITPHAAWRDILDGTLTTNANAIAAKAALHADPVYDVRDYGAIVDDGLDDTAAIQAAENALTTGGRLYFPPGTYLLLSTVTCDQPITIEGAVPNSIGGGRSVVMQADANTPAFRMQSIGVHMHNLAFTVWAGSVVESDGTAITVVSNTANSVTLSADPWNGQTPIIWHPATPVTATDSTSYADVIQFSCQGSWYASGVTDNGNGTFTLTGVKGANGTLNAAIGGTAGQALSAFVSLAHLVDPTTLDANAACVFWDVRENAFCDHLWFYQVGIAFSYDSLGSGSGVDVGTGNAGFMSDIVVDGAARFIEATGYINGLQLTNSQFYSVNNGVFYSGKGLIHSTISNSKCYFAKLIDVNELAYTTITGTDFGGQNTFGYCDDAITASGDTTDLAVTGCIFGRAVGSVINLEDVSGLVFAGNVSGSHSESESTGFFYLTGDLLRSTIAGNAFRTAGVTSYYQELVFSDAASLTTGTVFGQPLRTNLTDPTWNIGMGAAGAGAAGAGVHVWAQSASSGAAAGGDFTLSAGNGSGPAANGSVIIKAGETASPGSATTGGTVTLRTGLPSNSCATGTITLQGYTNANPPALTDWVVVNGANGILDARSGILSKNGTASAGFVDLVEDGDNGTSKLRMLGPAALASDLQYVWCAPAAGYLKSDASGNLSIDTPAGAGDFLADGSVPMTAPLFINEVAAASADQAGKGQIWVKNTTPNELWFTDDAGTDFQLGTAGAGDITSVWGDLTGDVGALTAEAGDTLDASLADSTVPWKVNAAAAPTVEGQTIWESDADRLRVGDGAATMTFAMTADKLSAFAATTSAELAGIISDEQGTGVAVYSDSPTFVDDITVAAAGVLMTGANGSLTILGKGDGADEDIKFDLNTTANTLTITSPASSLDKIDATGITVTATGFVGALTGNADTATTATNVTDADYGDVTVSKAAWAVENDSHDHSAAGSTVTINAADITDKNAGTDVTADLEEEAHNSEHAVSGADTVFPADPGFDAFLIWDDDPGTLAFVAVTGYQAADATLTDIADGTITENLVNTANPWADNEVADDITAGTATTAATANAGDAAVDFFGAGVTAVTDATTTTDIEGTGLAIAAGTLNWVSTEVEATTWGAGGNAANIWTFNVSGTDHTLTIGNGLMTFSHAVTISGTTTVGTLAGTIDAGGATSLEVPNGANPTASDAGQIAVDTSAGAGGMLRVYTDAAVALPVYQSKGFVILSPTADHDFPLPPLPYAITIRAIHVQCTGGTNIVGGLDEYNSEGATIVAAVDADITAAAGNSENDDGSLTNPGIAANNYLFWHTTSVSGSPTSVTVSYDYTVDQVN